MPPLAADTQRNPGLHSHPGDPPLLSSRPGLAGIRSEGPARERRRPLPRGEKHDFQCTKTAEPAWDPGSGSCDPTAGLVPRARAMPRACLQAELLDPVAETEVVPGLGGGSSLVTWGSSVTCGVGVSAGAGQGPPSCCLMGATEYTPLRPARRPVRTGRGLPADRSPSPPGPVPLPSG